MKFLAGVYDFVTGGSIAAPAGLFATLLVAYFGAGLPPPVREGAFFGMLLLTFFASAAERAR